MNEELRDVFAMAALAGMLAGRSTDKERYRFLDKDGQTAAPGQVHFVFDTYAPDVLCKDAYRFADGMIKAREQQ